MPQSTIRLRSKASYHNIIYKNPYDTHSGAQSLVQSHSTKLCIFILYLCSFKNKIKLIIVIPFVIISIGLFFLIFSICQVKLCKIILKSQLLRKVDNKIIQQSSRIAQPKFKLTEKLLYSPPP